MSTVLVDFAGGNLHSAQKAFERMAAEVGGGPVTVSADPDVVASADRLVLPGDGAFAACRSALDDCPGLPEALRQAVEVEGHPLLGICVGMQLLASVGYEYETAEGFGWIPGAIRRIAPSDPALKIPHMGWNDLVVERAHPVMEGVATGDHAYFVHSYQMEVERPADRLAHVDYGGPVTAIVAHDTVVGTQFHPEKSQATGLRLIANFLSWRP
ncbi:imidazole glycerol phosphate synthase subunit HisH [Histidinibacterium aquaticum]|uniref:Imidazole glycerol phosphate synthase subunit HisH n=1 Tax=Histidinibacterium aquaticum TaxID=2613962 RepID=A0A5J5GD39_9RHOB|nr:imidazole glycerol phosphate synthase subunit HisH [Histidinibacterium aquaticum]KAA9005692.1 imidazole glycerol phosphate synthase subunit HisH [Histidinibacterium aquaticum]